VKVDFFIAGAQKSGTTALHYFLRKNRSIVMGDKKELHFFNNDSLDWDRPDYEGLHRHFPSDGRTGRIRGEATPCYVYWPNALERLQRYNPAAKIIICLRHPTFRAFSQWRMTTTRGSEKRPFADAIAEDTDARFLHGRGGVLRAYLGRSLYQDQLQALLELFPREQILFIKTDDLWTETRSVVGAAERFLGVAPAAGVRRKYVVPLETAELGSIDPHVRARLDAFFAPTIEVAARLTSLDLSDWSRPDYEEPMKPRGSWLRRWSRRPGRN
jgi:hypothetical protein